MGPQIDPAKSMTSAMIIIKEKKKKKILQAEDKGNRGERDNVKLWGQTKWEMGRGVRRRVKWEGGSESIGLMVYMTEKKGIIWWILEARLRVTG